MNKENLNLEGLTAGEIKEQLLGKELNTKKNILEYIDIIKVFKGEVLTGEQMQETYNLIYSSIEDMISVVKTNTIMFLKNQLKGALGKYVQDKDPKTVDSFIEFFKEAYPPNFRKKDYTWVLMDKNRITKEQIWHTVTYINGLMLDGRRFSIDEKIDTIKMINKLLESNNLKYINQIKSFTKLQKALDMKLINKDGKLIAKLKKNN